MKKKVSALERMICQNPDCFKSGKEQSIARFYKSNVMGLSRYPVCKDCIQKMLKSKDMETVYSILMAMDIVFIKKYWDMAYRNNPENPFGKYITMINSMPKFKYLRYKDSIFGLIENETSLEYTDESKELNSEDELIYDVNWGGEFTKAELQYLNNYYTGLSNDYNIKTTNHKDYARKIAKASLAMDNALMDSMRTGDCKKYDSFRNTFDRLSQTAEFSENRRGADMSSSCFGVIAGMIENKEWIPIYEPLEKDTYDLLLEQFSNIQKSL